MNLLATVPDFAAWQSQLVPSVAAVAKRNETLATTRHIAAVLSQEACEGAVELARALASQVRETEAARKELKAPLLALGHRIDEIAGEFSEPAQAEYLRLMELVAQFQEAAHREAEEREFTRKAVIARLSLEADKLKAAAMATAAATAAEPNLDAYQVALTRLETAIMTPVPAANKVNGLVMRRTWTCRVDDVKALFGARQDLVKLTPDMARLRAIIPTPEPLPGVVQWQETAAHVRTA